MTCTVVFCICASRELSEHREPSTNRGCIPGPSYPDPWAAFVGYLTRLFEMQATDRGLSELLVTTSFDDDDRLAALRLTAQRGADEVIARAQSAGALRTDFTRKDLSILMRANAGVVARGPGPNAWQRQLVLIVEGVSAR